MKRKYADLHLCPDASNASQVAGLAEKAFNLGYRLIAVPFHPRVDEGQVKSLRKTCEEIGIDLASRIDLFPRSPDELLRDLRKVRRRFEIVAVMCFSKQAARQAAKDRRVDLLNFPRPDFRNGFFDSADAELASNSSASFEIDVEPLLVEEGVPRIRRLSMLTKEVGTAMDFHVPIVVSSGVSEQLLMRRPLEQACLGSLCGLCEFERVESVSTNPIGLVSRSREKLSWCFVAPGIKVVRRGNDC